MSRVGFLDDGDWPLLHIEAKMRLASHAGFQFPRQKKGVSPAAPTAL